MQAPTAQIAASSLGDAYREYDLNLRVQRAMVCCVLSLVLMPAGVSLDYFVYPKLLWPILQNRLLCDLILLPCLAVLFTKFGRRHIGILGHAPALLPGLSICWMIYASEGALSPYYAGLNLVLVGVILLIPYTLREAAMFCGFLMVGYATACLLHRWLPPATSLSNQADAVANSTLYNNLYFLSLTAIISVTACHFSGRRRFEEFRLRHELDVNNQQLAATLKKLQETEVQLVQSEKMNALGKLSAGLLHEVNNPLNFTFMALQVARQEAGDNASLNETLADIEQGMTRIRGVISDLRSFAHPSTLAFSESFNLDDVLTTALRLTAHELGTIPVERQGLTDFGNALGAKTQIVHVLMNLLVNSAHALKAAPGDRQPRVVVACTRIGPRLQVSLWDNGIGVRTADLPRLTEPFFTTKEPGQGTGLGLSICHTIIQNHSGKLEIASTEGQWTKVTFDLPASQTQGAAPATPTPPPASQTSASSVEPERRPPDITSKAA